MIDQEKREKAQAMLDGYKSFNGGRGLMLHRDLVKELRAMGITGPYVEVVPVKEVETMLTMTRDALLTDEDDEQYLNILADCVTAIDKFLD